MKSGSNNNNIDSGKDVESRHPLAPCRVDPNNPGYKSVVELEYALSQPECKNIAITGVYGSGKSSIIDTCLSLETSPKNVLRISLSNFTDSNIEAQNENSYENEIEFKIFQHIIYKADIDKTSRSRFKRLRVIDNNRIKIISCCIILFFLCYIIVFEPEFLRIDSFYQAYHSLFKASSNKVNVIADIVASCTMICLLYMLVVDLVRRCSDINISHLKAKDVEINFTDEKSVFNELLDEIIYYLQSGGYDLVVFEDLDRISKPQKLFLKLREINILLNESAYYIDKGKCIRFLYAIRDDVFEKEVRAKCFDYIIPVIPIVNNFNAGEYLISNYPTELNGISTTDIKRLGLFISSMRELINIMNEYMLYRKTILKESMSPKKLFAIILYKNLFPNDYSLAHTKEGYLFNAFNNKHYFSDQFTKEPKEELNSTAIVIQNERDAITILREQVLV